MSTSAQSITLDTGAIVPASCDQQTDLALLTLCVEAYHVITNGTVALATLQTVIAAMRDASAVIALYTDGKCGTAARCLWIASVAVTRERHLVTHTFRLDRMLAVHALTTPDDAEPQEQPVPMHDPAKIAVRIGQALAALSHNATLDTADTALLSDAIDDVRQLYKVIAVA